MDIIFYHGSCSDGWCAAYICKKRYPNAELVPLNHGLLPEALEELFRYATGKNVIMVDYSLRTRELNDRLNAVAKSFRILDHHKTAQAVLEDADYATFDMERSGAGLAWDYLFGTDSEKAINTDDDGATFLHIFQSRPWFVDYIEDRDLWNWTLPESKKICAYLGILELNKEDWDKLDSISPVDAAGRGAGALDHINHYVRETVKQAQPGVLQGYKTAVLNVPYLNCSEVGNELAKTHDVSLTWFERGDGMIQFSLRSIGDIDVSSIARIFGGGGHKNAAGFQKSVAEGRPLVDYILARGVQQQFVEGRSPGGCA